MTIPKERALRWLYKFIPQRPQKQLLYSPLHSPETVSVGVSVSIY